MLNAHTKDTFATTDQGATDEFGVPVAAHYEDSTALQQGTIKPYPNFTADHVEDVAKDFRKAFRGLGTDENRIIRLLTEHNNEQRQELIKAYKTAHGRDLIEDLQDELSGSFEDLCLALLTPTRLYDANCLRDAMKGLGTEDQWLIELLCPRTNEEMQQINESYSQLYKKKLEDDVVEETSGVYQKILVSVCQANREQATQPDMAKVTRDAKNLYDAGEGRLGTDEETFNLVFAKRSWPHLRAVCKEYRKLAGRDLEESIEREFSFNAKKAFVTIVQYAKDPHQYYAERIRAAAKGREECDDSLTRLIVSHSETDLENIKTSFLAKYKEPMETLIKKETYGDFKKLLIRILDPQTSFK